MKRTRRPSPQTVAVLRALAEEPSRWSYGYDLGRSLGLKAGTIYPILIRLTERGHVAATWEPDPPPGRPARHLYRLTPNGVDVVAALERAEGSRVQPDLAPGTT
jgi:DNA-binding PadR family transcriptional regulator